MNFVREILEPGILNGIIDIPEELRHSKVEVIILPAKNSSQQPSTTISKGKKRFKDLYENPIQVEKIKIFSREELHER